MNDLIRTNLKEIVKLQDTTKKDNLNYKSKRRKAYNFGKYSLPIVFSGIYMKDIYQYKNLIISELILPLN